MRIILSALAVLTIVTFCHGQAIPLINSGEVIARAQVLYDSGKYDLASKDYLTISPYDTNYYYALTELALTYQAAEQYDKAIETSLRVLEKPNYHRSHAWRTLGSSYDNSGNFEKSVEAYKNGLKEFPFDYHLYFNLGVTYFNHNDFKEAERCFIETIRLSPFYSGAHYNLGLIAAREGKKVRAMMAIGTYLAIQNDNNARLVFLEQFLNNEFKEEGSIVVDQENAFKKLDQIIKAKIVTDKSFKPIIPLNAMLVKQFQLLFEQLPETPPNKNDFWLEYYLPIYQALKKANLYEPFMYHILQSSSFDDVKKWTSRNEKQMKAFYGVANESITAIRTRRELPASFGFTGPVSMWYSSKGTLDAIGNMNGEARTGRWLFYEDNAQLLAEGSYDDKGERTGAWKEYYPSGRLKERYQAGNGTVETYDEEGNIKSRYTLKDGKAEGVVEFFNPCGIVTEKIAYKAGKREGKGGTFFPSGDVDDEYEFKDDEREGAYRSYYENRTLETSYAYKAGKLNGPFLRYYSNGKLMRSGNYANDMATGIWKYYHANGRLSREGTYTNDIQTGEWKSYDTRGELIERQMFDSKGKLVGENPLYYHGKLRAMFIYKDGVIVSSTYYDANGTVLGKAGSKDGTFSLKGYFLSGELRFSGSYKKGVLNGEWVYYYRNGKKKSVVNYQDGMLNGTSTEYFKTGQIKKITNYKNDELDGYQTEYHVNGKIKEEGWCLNGWRQQQWRSYYPDGSLESEQYYFNGSRHGRSTGYGFDGKVINHTDYNHERMQRLQLMNDKGVVIYDQTIDKPVEPHEVKYKNGKVSVQSTIVCGEYGTDIIRYYPNGKVYLVNPVMNSRTYGEYRYNNPEGVTEAKGTMLEGLEEGVWRWFDKKGNLHSVGNYIHGNRDSLWVWYDDNGKISSDAMYQDDEKEGTSRYYAPDGTLVLEKIYEEGDLVSYRVTDASGKMGAWKKYTGNETITAYYDNGKKAYEETHRDGLLEGTRETFYKDGTLCERYQFSKGDYEGPFVVNYPSGKVHRKGEYKWDELNGRLEEFSETGAPELTEEFKFGYRHGTAVRYSNGKKSSEIRFSVGIIQE